MRKNKVVSINTCSGHLNKRGQYWLGHIYIKRVSFSLTQFKHGSTEIAKVFKRIWSSDQRLRQRNLRLKEFCFSFLSEQKQGFRQEPLFSNYVHSKICCSDIHWPARRLCVTIFPPLLLEESSCFGSQNILNQPSNFFFFFSTLRFGLGFCLVFI